MVKLIYKTDGNEYNKEYNEDGVEFKYRGTIPFSEKRIAAVEMFALKYTFDESIHKYIENIDSVLARVYIAIKHYTNIDIDEVVKQCTIDDVFDYINDGYDLVFGEYGIAEEDMYLVTDMANIVYKQESERKDVMNNVRNKLFSYIDQLPEVNSIIESLSKDADTNSFLIKLLAASRDGDTGRGSVTSNINFSKKKKK